MCKCLYLICPTDYLESIINKNYPNNSIFYTSLGNSFLPDKETLKHLKELIVLHKITEIQFILSEDNPIVLDAFG